MGVVTVRPNSNNSPTGWTAAGGTLDLHGVLADDSDATYVSSSQFPAGLVLGFPAPSIPAGALVKLALFQMRAEQVGAGPVYVGGLFKSAGAEMFFNQLVTWTSPTEVWASTLLPGNGSLNLSGLNVAIASSYLARIYEVRVRVVYVAKPVTTVSGPVGTLTTDNRPTVGWAPTLDQHGGEQTRFQVRIFDATTYGAFGSVNPSTDVPYADSGVKAGNDLSWRASVPLVDDDYRAYVRVAQTVNGIIHWSDWNSTDFTVDVDLPGVPAVSLLGEDNFARISIELEETAGAADTDWWEVETSPDGLSGWQDLLTEAGGGVVMNPTPGSAGTEVVGDYEPANTEVRWYRARAVTDHGSEVTVTSDWSTPVSAAWDSASWWLKHRELAGLNLAVMVDEQPGWERPSRDGEFQGLSAESSVIVSDTAGPKRGTISFGVDSDLDREKLLLLFEQRDPVLVQSLPGSLWPDRWVRLLNHRERPFVDRHGVTLTIDQFDWIEVSRPD